MLCSRRSSGGWVVVDQASLDGTYLNRARVEQGKLFDGDEVQVGNYHLVSLPAQWAAGCHTAMHAMVDAV